MHDLDYRTTLILVADTFDPAFGKSIIHDSVLFDWSGYKNDAVRTSEATTKNSAALRTFALVNIAALSSKKHWKFLLFRSALENAKKTTIM